MNIQYLVIRLKISLSSLKKYFKQKQLVVFYPKATFRDSFTVKSN